MATKTPTLNDAVRTFLEKCGCSHIQLYNTLYKDGSYRVKVYGGGHGLHDRASKVFGRLLSKPAFSLTQSYQRTFSLVLVFKDTCPDTVQMAIRSAEAMRKRIPKEPKPATNTPRFLLIRTTGGSYQLQDKTTFSGEKLDRATILAINKAINRRLL